MNVPGQPPRFQDRLLQGDDRFRLLFEDAPVPYHEIDCQGRIRRVNRAECAMLGYDPAELIGKPVWEFLAPEQRDMCRDAIAARIAARGPFDPIQRRLQGKNGDVISVRATASLIKEANESPAILALIEDVTPRRVAEQELAESLNHLRALAAKLMHAQDDERRRIAQMLHETTAQDLAALKMLLAGLSRTSDRLSTADRALLDESLQLADHSMTGVRTLSYLLYPPFLDEAGLLSAVRWYAQGFSQRSGIKVALDLPAT